MHYERSEMEDPQYGLSPQALNDRELLELAAYASGEWPSPEPFEHVMDRWNPLTDDGDALRLAVKLNLHRAIAEAHRLVSNDVDFYAATRRAIVLAAAEIGRSTAPAF
jgi:hypothetical protein